MQLLLVLIPVLSVFVGHAASIPTKRQDVVGVEGSIVAPSDSTAIAPGATFDFGFDSVNYCESGYEPITVWLLPQAPSVDDMTSDGGFAEGSYVYEFGEWLIPNFGLPTMSPGPPPSTLVMPDFSTAAEGSLFFTNKTFYLTVVEKYTDCPGNVPAEYGITGTHVVYNATSST